MRPGTARKRWLVLLLGAALVACAANIPAAPAETPPEGFAWEELKDIRAWVLRPAGWGFRQTMLGVPLFDFSPAPFAGPVVNNKGATIHLMARENRPADKAAAGWVAQCALQCKVLRGWARTGVPAEPFTSYGIVGRVWDEETGAEYICEVVFVANRVTNSVYYCRLAAPATEWSEVEAAGETMLANLRLDPKF